MKTIINYVKQDFGYTGQKEVKLVSDDFINNAIKGFRLPISYDDNKRPLTVSIASDLELFTGDAENTTTAVYDTLYGYLGVTVPAKHVAKIRTVQTAFNRVLAQYFTTDLSVLKPAQQSFIVESTISGNGHYEVKNTVAMIDMATTWEQMRANKNFNEMYNYLDWPMLHFINDNETYLQVLQTLNMASPMISLLSPLMLLITPLLIIREMKRRLGIDIPLTFETYIRLVKEGFSDGNAIGKLLNMRATWSKTSMTSKVWTVMSAVFYIWSFYQSSASMVTFNRRMNEVYSFNRQLWNYLDLTIREMNRHLIILGGELPAAAECIIIMPYHQFKRDIATMRNKLCEWRERLHKDVCDRGWSMSRCDKLGAIMREFYGNHHIAERNALIEYTVGFHAYCRFTSGVSGLLKRELISACEFITARGDKVGGGRDRGTILKQNRYAALCSGSGSQVVTNTIKIGGDAPIGSPRNMIISGPNASGKTTLMKAVLLNILLSQQIGMGFYAEGTRIRPYDYLHCYLNIPDTNGRDSLFQAEARRCKTILDSIRGSGDDKRHFIIFDELFSGTNPEEAIKSSAAFVKYLNKRANVEFMLTTHYKGVCRQFRSREGSADVPATIDNFQMKVVQGEGGRLEYTYKLKKGISKVKGGLEVLRAMDYPAEMFVVEDGNSNSV